MNPLFLIDGYKLDHRRQYPPGTTRVYSNFTPRTSRVEGSELVVNFGLQYFLQKYMMDGMQAAFDNPRYTVEQYARRVNQYLGPNAVGTEHIEALLNLGYVPLEFRALEEGTLTPLQIPMFTVENTHDDFAWLVNYFETLLSNAVWMPSTSATTAYRYRTLLDAWALGTHSAAMDFVPWQGHDFSFRGLAGEDAALSSAAGHALSFTGSDTFPLLEWIDRYYPGENGVVAGSIPATEHSVMCAGGEKSELETFRHLLDVYPSGPLSVVSDTWDLWKVITEILPQLKGEIMSRDGKLVIRPDSGNPVDILCGLDGMCAKSPMFGDAEKKGVIELLWSIFGGTTSAEGYKVLDPHIGAIYGDSITVERAREICERLAAKGFASTNVVLGIGSYTYQYVTRDTYGFAMKATWAKVDGVGRDLFKKPVTDNGGKASAKGRLAVIKDAYGRLKLLQNMPEGLHANTPLNNLQAVWRDGQFLRRQSFADVRNVLHCRSQKDGLLL